MGGGSVTAMVTSGPGNRLDWVGVYPVGAPDSGVALLDWKYLTNSRTPPASGLSNATLMFAMPLTAGSYELRLFTNNSYARIAVSATITVTSTGAALSVSPTSVTGGGMVTANVMNGPGNPLDWVGVYLVGTPDTSVGLLDWKYLNNSQTAPSSGLSNATLTFTMPVTAGSYELRLFINNSYVRIAVSPSVTVTPMSAEPRSLLVAVTAGDSVWDYDETGTFLGRLIAPQILQIPR
jgi:hypothetical protein